MRIWTSPHLEAGGTYPVDDGHVVVDSIEEISLEDITDDIAGESGYRSAADLLSIAKHGSEENVYLIRFHYVPSDASDVPSSSD